MRVLVCGGRTFCMKDGKYIIEQMEKAFEWLDVIHAERQFTCVIQGEAHGGDTVGKTWAKLEGIPVECYPANWKKYGKRAGYIRNKQMLDEGNPELIIALPGGEGTDMMKRIGRESGVEVIEVE